MVSLVTGCTNKTDKVCTMIFASVTVSIHDSLGNPVLLDSNYSQLVASNKIIKIKNDSVSGSLGIYQIINEGLNTVFHCIKPSLF